MTTSVFALTPLNFIYISFVIHSGGKKTFINVLVRILKTKIKTLTTNTKAWNLQPRHLKTFELQLMVTMVKRSLYLARWNLLSMSSSCVHKTFDSWCLGSLVIDCFIPFANIIWPTSWYLSVGNMKDYRKKYKLWPSKTANREWVA